MADFKISSLQMTAFWGRRGGAGEHLIALEHLHLTQVSERREPGNSPTERTVLS